MTKTPLHHSFFSPSATFASFFCIRKKKEKNPSFRSKSFYSPTNRSLIRMTQATEEPFRPRELLQQKQKFFQSVQKHTYLKGRFDKITSVAIPLALTITCGSLIARGVYNMSHGIGKKE